MANKSIRMSTLRQILTLKTQGRSNKAISGLLGISRTTVVKYVGAIRSCGKPASELLKHEDSELQILLGLAEEPDLSQRLQTLHGFFPYMEKELKRVGVTRQLLWHSYKQEYPDGYNYSQFCYHFQQWGQSKDAVMHFEHKAGDKLFVDYAGKKLKIRSWVHDREQELEVFVAVLGASQYTYVEVSESQQSEDFITSVQNALHYLGGVPQAIVTDNLKAAVTKSSRYEPKLNETFEDLANHYGMAVLPTRAYKPRDKALVEGAVKIVYQRIHAVIRDMTFHSIESLNERIRELLDGHNNRLFQGRAHSRKDLFEQIDQPVLNPLPSERYEIKHYAWVKVQKNGHVRLGEDKHYYSVPYRYIGRKVKLCYTLRNVEVISKGERIALHKRVRVFYTYTTIADHLSSQHNFVAGWKPELFLDWALGIGKPTLELIRAVLDKRVHPEQAYKSCQGILSFAKKYGSGRLNRACERALLYHCISYRCIKDILEKGLDQLEDDPAGEEQGSHIPDHENIRGKDAFK